MRNNVICELADLVVERLLSAKATRSSTPVDRWASGRACSWTRWAPRSSAPPGSCAAAKRGVIAHNSLAVCSLVVMWWSGRRRALTHLLSGRGEGLGTQHPDGDLGARRLRDGAPVPVELALEARAQPLQREGRQGRARAGVAHQPQSVHHVVQVRVVRGAQLHQVRDDGEAVLRPARHDVAVAAGPATHVHQLQLHGVAREVHAVLAALVVAGAPAEEQRVQVVHALQRAALQTRPPRTWPLAHQLDCNRRTLQCNTPRPSALSAWVKVAGYCQVFNFFVRKTHPQLEAASAARPKQ